MNKKNMMRGGKETEFLYDINASQMGVGCNKNDEILIHDFRGVLTWVYAQKTDEIQTHVDPLVPMTADHGGFMPSVTIRANDWPSNRGVTLVIGQEINLPDMVGKTLRLQYKAIDHIAVVFVDANKKGFLSRVG